MNETLPILKNVTAELEAKPGSSEIEAMPLQQDVSDSEAACEQSSPPKQWRSLEELAETPEFEDMLHREFPRHAAVWDSGLDRRKFLTVAGASMGLAGLTACTKQPPESIIPYVRQPEEIVPGKPLFFATTTTLLGHALGLLAESHMGRPTKVEGHPDHPASLGGSDSIAQASVLDLYDPDRSQAVLHLGRIRSWDAFVTEITAAVESFKARGGAGLRILSGTSSSPTMGALMTELLAEMPEARWHQFESAATDNARTGIRQALGADLAPCCDLERAEVVLSIDSDFLGSGVTAIRYSRDFSKRRQVRDVEKLKQDGMSRLYAVDTEPTATSAAADHRLALNPTEISHFVVALAAQLGVVEAEAHGFDSGPKAAWVEEVAADLQANAGASLVIAGEYSDPEIQTLVCAINAKLGNVGTTVTYRDSIELHPADEPLDQASSFAELLA
ncbi:MAG: TAT-variant-translocated molybdopterin oxidoreductase, partial [Acidobacteriota bacterium]